MFFGASAFNQDIGGWNATSGTDFEGIFDGAIRLSNAPIFTRAVLDDLVESYWTDAEWSTSWKARAYGMTIDEWDVSHVTDFSALFKDNVVHQDPIAHWNVSRGTNFASMFEGASAFNQDIGEWDVSSGTDLSNMFSGATAFDQAIGSWAVSSVTDFSHMLEGATSFNQAIGDWDVSSGTNFVSELLVSFLVSVVTLLHQSNNPFSLIFC